MLKMEVRVKSEDGAGGFTFKDYPVAEIKFRKSFAGNAVKDDEDDEE